MEIKESYGFSDLENRCWSGAIDTLKTIRDNDKEEELMQLLEIETFSDEIPSITEVNDFLWFEDEYIFEALGINEMEDEDDEY